MLRITEVAERLNVSIDTVRRMIETGKLVAVDVSGSSEGKRSYRIECEELERYLRENRTG